MDTGPAPAGAAHVFVDDLEAPALSPDDRHHLERVLRLRAGEEVTVSDGAGGWRRCRLGPVLEPSGPRNLQPRPGPPITVAMAVAKGQRPEWAVQKLTELGVDRIIPLVTARSVVRWPAGATSGPLERWRRVARQAAGQSRRVWLPEVADAAPFAEVSRYPGATLAHPGGRGPALARPVVLVGPEGGWDERELQAGLPRARLGPHVLRTETAAVVAGALLCALRDELVVLPDPAG